MPETIPRAQRVGLVAASIATAAAAGAEATGAADLARFVLGGIALAALAALVGQALEAVGERVGPGATGILQSTLGNLPELFVGIFALRDGLPELVRATLVGSVLGNVLLVLGVAFVAGGLRHGTQRFDPEEPRLYGSLLLLAVAALLVPTLAAHLDTPAAHHLPALSDVCAVALLAVYAASIPFTLARSREASAAAADGDAGRDAQPLAAAAGLLVLASAGAAVVSDWFVGALTPATHTLGISQAFTGLVIVAVASNAVENAVGVRFALRAKPAYALSTTLASPLQVALLLTPVLVLLSAGVGPHALTLVFPPLLVAALGLATLVVVVVVYDGEYTWIEGVALLGLYVIVATAFFWG
jgi:Ca2+:H+ antiporter